jgi:hypothetical protein
MANIREKQQVTNDDIYMCEKKIQCMDISKININTKNTQTDT